MEKRRVRRLLRIHEEGNRSLRYFTRKRADSKRCLHSPGDDFCGSPHVLRKWLKEELIANMLLAAVSVLHTIDGANGRKNTDAADEDPAKRGFTRCLWVSGAAKASIHRGGDISHREFWKLLIEAPDKRPPLLHLPEFLTPQLLKPGHLRALLRPQIALLVGGPVVSNDGEQLLCGRSHGIRSRPAWVCSLTGRLVSVHPALFKMLACLPLGRTCPRHAATRA
jgi:hypothetical protein